MRNQSGSHWVFKNIIPFFTITLVTSKDVIEESRLPDFSAAEDGGRYSTFQSANPDTKIKLRGSSYEEVHMIRHKDVAAYSNTMIHPRETVAAKIFVNFIGREPLRSMKSTKGHEIKRLTDVNQVETWWFSFNHGRCRLLCRGRRPRRQTVKVAAPRQ